MTATTVTALAVASVILAMVQVAEQGEIKTDSVHSANSSYSRFSSVGHRRQHCMQRPPIVYLWINSSPLLYNHEGESTGWLEIMRLYGALVNCRDGNWQWPTEEVTMVNSGDIIHINYH